MAKAKKRKAKKAAKPKVVREPVAKPQEGDDVPHPGGYLNLLQPDCRIQEGLTAVVIGIEACEYQRQDAGDKKEEE